MSASYPRRVAASEPEPGPEPGPVLELGLGLEPELGPGRSAAVHSAWGRACSYEEYPGTGFSASQGSCYL